MDADVAARCACDWRGLLRRTGGYLDLWNGDEGRNEVPVSDPVAVRDAGHAWRRKPQSRVRVTEASTEDENEFARSARRQLGCLGQDSIGHVELSELRDQAGGDRGGSHAMHRERRRVRGHGRWPDQVATFFEEEKDGKARFLAFSERKAKDPNNFRSYCLHIRQRNSPCLASGTRRSADARSDR